jgi:hypothetical protein
MTRRGHPRPKSSRLIAPRNSALTPARMAKYLEGLRRYYNCNVKDRFFVVGDLVLRRKQKIEGLHKLASHWEGPYMVKQVTRPTSYRLCDPDRVDVPNSWHIDQLRRFYA